jgi:hypothetical protein
MWGVEVNHPFLTSVLDEDEELSERHWFINPRGRDHWVGVKAV